MKRSELEKYLGKRVTITLFDGDVISGELHKTGEEAFKNDLNFYIPQKHYFCTNPITHTIFRCSHVKKLKEE